MTELLSSDFLPLLRRLCISGITLVVTVKFKVRETAIQHGFGNAHALATKTGLPVSVVYKIWNGEQSRIDLETISKLCAALGVKPGALFEYDP